MVIQIKRMLQDLGRDSIYSAKEHFKASDIRRILIRVCVVGGALLSIVLAVFSIEGLLAKILNVLTLFFMIALLMLERDAYYCHAHKEWGEKYLAYHKKIEMLVKSNADVSNNDVEQYVKELNDLNTNCPCIVNRMARRMGKRSIERKNPETDNWFCR